MRLRAPLFVSGLAPIYGADKARPLSGDAGALLRLEELNLSIFHTERTARRRPAPNEVSGAAVGGGGRFC